MNLKIEGEIPVEVEETRKADELPVKPPITTSLDMAREADREYRGIIGETWVGYRK